jgi:hypothetical protein
LNAERGTGVRGRARWSREASPKTMPISARTTRAPLLSASTLLPNRTGTSRASTACASGYARRARVVRRLASGHAGA